MDFSPDLILVDGSSFMFRAYHSSMRRDFRNERNEPVGAVMIFSKMLTALREQHSGIPCVMIFDAPVRCFRYQLFPEYKANRRPMDEDLRVQIPRIREISAAMGCDVISVEGVEADDVIGTYAVSAADRGQRVLIMTGDKDLFQLVRDNVILENTMTGEFITRETGTAKYGVPPELMIDYLALVGDSADNIPGMAGTGPKTAAAVLNSLGGIEDIARDPDRAASLNFRGARNFPGKFRECLEDIRLSRRLATIVLDVQVPLPEPELRWHAPDYGALGSLYRDAGLRALYESLPRVEDDGKTEEIPPLETVYEPSRLEEVMRRASQDRYGVIRIFSSGPDRVSQQILGLGLALRDRSSYYVPLAHSFIGGDRQMDAAAAAACIREFAAREDAVKVIHDAGCAIHALARIGVTLAGDIRDPSLEAWMLDSSRGKYSLPELAAADLDRPLRDFQELLGAGRSRLAPEEVPPEQAAELAGEELAALRSLQDLYEERMASQPDLGERYRTRILPMTEVLAEMEHQGVGVSVADLRQVSMEFAGRLGELEDRIYELAGRRFNIGSPKQVASVLFEEQKMIPQDQALARRIKAGKYSTNEEVLSDLAQMYELPADILEHRGLSKLINTYSSALPDMINPDTGRIHTTFHLNGTSTGRLSSSGPNLQNIPARTPEGRRIRRAFAARKGFRIVAADYSQIELRILAHLSGDEALIGSFLRGEDIHRRTASEILGIPFEQVTSDQRRSAKAVNFGILYGMSAFGLARQLKIDQKLAQKYIDGYFARYGRIREYLTEVVAGAREKGYVETVTGRRIPVRDIRSDQDSVFRAASRVATNAPMQGSAADIIQTAMIRVHRFLKDEASRDSAFMVLQVHDELVLEIREDLAEAYAARVSEIMSGACELRVPLEVGTGIADNWEQAH